MNGMYCDHRRERELLSRFLRYPGEQIHIARITSAVFDHQTNRSLFACLKAMHAKGHVITANTISDWLDLNSVSIEDIHIKGLAYALAGGQVEVPGIVYVDGQHTTAGPELPQITASRLAVTAEEHIPYLVELMGKRRVSHVSGRMAEMLATSSLDSIVAFVEREMGAFEQGHEVRGIEDITAAVRERIMRARTEGPSIIRTGFAQVDEAIGLMPSTHCLIIGRSGEGKSALANQLVTNICQYNENISVLYFSMEIQEEKLIENFIANLSDTTKDRMRGKGIVPISDVEMQGIDEQIALINTFDIEIHYGSKDAREAGSIIDVFAAKRRGRQLVIVTDHHLYIKDHQGSMQDAVNAFSKMYISKKEQYKALTFLLCQFHLKHTESENNRGEQIPPDAKWIMYPGTLFMDADVTCAIWRKNRHEGFETESELLELYWQKNREGQPEFCSPLIFTPKYGRFRDVDPTRIYPTEPATIKKLALAQLGTNGDGNGHSNGHSNGKANGRFVNGKDLNGSHFPDIDF